MSIEKKKQLFHLVVRIHNLLKTGILFPNLCSNREIFLQGYTSASTVLPSVFPVFMLKNFEHNTREFLRYLGRETKLNIDENYIKKELFNSARNFDAGLIHSIKTYLEEPLLALKPLLGENLWETREDKKQNYVVFLYKDLANSPEQAQGMVNSFQKLFGFPNFSYQASNSTPGKYRIFITLPIFEHDLVCLKSQKTQSDHLLLESMLKSYLLKARKILVDLGGIRNENKNDPIYQYLRVIRYTFNLPNIQVSIISPLEELLEGLSTQSSHYRQSQRSEEPQNEERPSFSKEELTEEVALPNQSFMSPQSTAIQSAPTSFGSRELPPTSFSNRSKQSKEKLTNFSSFEKQ